MKKNLARGFSATIFSIATAVLCLNDSTRAQPAPRSTAPITSPFTPLIAPLIAPPLKVAFVYVSPIGNAGWSYQHDLGRIAMQQALGDKVKTTVVESVSEGADSERVMRDLAQQGHQLIFATSFGYLEPALRVAAEFPDVKFEHAGGFKTSANLNIYNARYYEARYLAGMLAGQTSRSGTAGYVAGFAVPEVVQGINAFTLGMRAVNPKAQVKVLWLNTWFDPAREREAAQTLINQGADTLTNHSGSTAVAQTAEDNFKTKGTRVVSYQSDMRSVAPNAQLTAIVHRWGGYYTAVAQAVLNDTWKAQTVWGSMAQGFVALAPLASNVPGDVATQLKAKQRAIEAGSLQPFSGLLLDNEGKVRWKSGAMPDAEIAEMNWFVQGVVGSLPRP
ncbi:MAG: BMP family ABC transporter substrate-binding protein [Pseudorhodobacter sp.]|nr:BMP family ABC transporter substrate-binding protein [Rhizobacter sp.]